MTLRSVKALRGNPIVAQNGEIGFIVDVYFDDERWTVRYLLVGTGRTMPRREVLIASASIARASPGDDSIRVQLTRAQVEKSPEIDARRPVSRQHEMTCRGLRFRQANLDEVVAARNWLPGKRVLVPP